MKVQSVRFEEFTVPDESVIHFPEGILPFGKNLDFALLSRTPDSMTAWLQCVQNPELAFWVGHVARLFPDHKVELDAVHYEIIGMEEGTSHLSILTILSLHEDEITANLLAPLLINTKEKIGYQVILLGGIELVRMPLAAEVVAKQAV